MDADLLHPDGVRLHVDEARLAAIETMKRIVSAEPAISAAALVDDLVGRISVTLWIHDFTFEDEERLIDVIRQALSRACAQYWTDYIAVSHAPSPDADDDLLHRVAWQEGWAVEGMDRLRLNDRHRHHTGWFLAIDQSEQLWPLDEGPPVVVFHGFKGGVGRTTLLAGYALACARRNQRAVIVDIDLDAPGVGMLLGADADGTTARWGTLDFLLESTQQLPLDDYFHVCAREALTGSGRIEVFPAGALDDSYLPKLGRVDLEVHNQVHGHPLGTLLRRIRSERTPDVILLDGRAGLSPAAGLLLSGIAHLHVLVATSNIQSLRGLERVVRHLGYNQARRELPQRECIVVQAHVPDSTDAARHARAHFGASVERIFRDGYYSQKSTDDDRTWSLLDLDSEVAPHVPVPISYRGRLAHFEAIDEVADLLLSDPDHLELHRRIDERLGGSIVGPQGPGEEEVDG